MSFRSTSEKWQENAGLSPRAPRKSIFHLLLTLRPHLFSPLAFSAKFWFYKQLAPTPSLVYSITCYYQYLSWSFTSTSVTVKVSALIAINSVPTNLHIFFISFIL